MPLVVTCSRGHVTEVDDRLAHATICCPHCDETLHVPGPSPAPEPAPPDTPRARGLWSMMQPVADAASVGRRDAAENVGATTLDHAEPAFPRGVGSTYGAPAEDASGPIVEIPPPSNRIVAAPHASPHAASADAPSVGHEGMYAALGIDDSGPIVEVPAPAGWSVAGPPASRDVVSADAGSVGYEVGRAPAPRGLWALMGGRATPETDTPPAAPSAPTERPAPQPKLRSLWSLTRKSAAADESAVDLEIDEEFERAAAEPARQELHPLAPAKPAEPLPAIKAVPVLPKGKPSSGRKRAIASAILGMIAVPLSFLAVIPEFWSRIPGTIFGFAALLLGFMASQDVNRSRERRGLGWAACGIVLGALGVLFGPVVLGKFELWQRTQRHLTGQHLTKIGAALEQHHTANGKYPPGGEFRQLPNGGTQPMHGWMTALLPYLGHEQLYGQVQRNQPWDSPDNQVAMEQTVPEFLASGGNPAPVHGLGVTHFAGVGGELELSTGDTAQAGIFGPDSEVTQADVTDGLSNTLVAGEIATELVPWGHPLNWRTPERGLNADLTGFGNARGDGAMFLMADGSVKFFPNTTDPAVLKALATRDGGD